MGIKSLTKTKSFMRNILFMVFTFFVLFACSEGPENAKAVAQPEKSQTENRQVAVPDLAQVMLPNDDDIILGDKNADIVLIEYFAPTCPHCAYYRKRVFPEIQKKYIDTKKIAYVIREFIANKQDLDAAILARCSVTQDRILTFINVILNQQNNWSTTGKYRDILTNIGQLGGVSAEEYAKCLSDEKLVSILLNNTRAVSRAPNFIGTPAFFLRGHQLVVPHSLESLSAELDKALEK